MRTSGILRTLAALLLISLPALARTPRALIEDFTKEQDFQGVVLLARGGKVLHAGAYGHADFEAHRRTSLETRYQLGSISKLVASIVVLKLVDEGKLSLTAPIATYLPDYRADSGAKVTLHHLLSHTSGVPNDLVASFKKDPSIATLDLSMDEAVKRFASGDLAFEPGARFDYSHSNWVLVKAIIERVTGRTYAQEVQRVLLRPLRLKSAGIFTGDFARVPRAAQGYSAIHPAPKRGGTPNPSFIECAGGYYSSAKDLLTLTRAVYGGKVLSADALKRLTTVYVPEEAYSYGGRMRTLTLGGREKQAAWHTGSNGPFRSRLSHVLGDDLTFIVLSNANASLDATQTLAEQVLAAVAPAGRSPGGASARP
ncbi:beta-lactamase family protein [Aggregicoccus sp. 17bor-14]|uniref:serine hydrolase domain-containing protein n=1 Tax=Myxococcaceae TaxID=31 RepID=UPI00129D1F16|nr:MULTISPECIES: serine hydrolase domain-containing protein [Myxococcaceae]MBF5042004.1 beta-lactamase family protein [Simulacricoccus sp. 17bor-14]MRI87784.1 beta-lactamase family protein [Aggregicoccus sp. 17bor-14]